MAKLINDEWKIDDLALIDQTIETGNYHFEWCGEDVLTVLRDKHGNNTFQRFLPLYKSDLGSLYSDLYPFTRKD